MCFSSWTAVCTHGALAWKNPIPRRGVLIKYQSKNVNWGGGVLDPQDRWGDMVEDMTEGTVRCHARVPNAMAATELYRDWL